MALKKVDYRTLSFNPFTKLDRNWALLAAGEKGKWNAMTVSWGGMGTLWGAPAVTVYVRKSRYTLEFIEKSPIFTLTFLQDGHKDALSVYGSKSGRDIDKMAGCGLTPCFVEGHPTFEEAETVFVCRKRFHQYMPPEQFEDDETIKEWYADNNFHNMFVGEVIACYQNG